MLQLKASLLDPPKAFDPFKAIPPHIQYRKKCGEFHPGYIVLHRIQIQLVIFIVRLEQRWSYQTLAPLNEMGFLSLLVLSVLLSLVAGISATRPERRTAIPSVVNNCSGTAQPDLLNQIASAPGYAPNLPPQGDGWEEWVMVVEGIVNTTENPLFFARWSRGDPASPNSKLEDGIFAFRTSFDNGTTWTFALNGTLVYSDVNGVKTWAIGDNKLVFDGKTGDWNHSIAHPGFSFQSHIHMYVRVYISISVCPAYLVTQSQSPTRDAIHPGHERRGGTLTR